MRERGERYISSTRLSEQINIDASQIAKDLSFVNISGRTRVGYEIDSLIRVLEDFLGFTRLHKAYLFGVGSLGGASYLASQSGSADQNVANADFAAAVSLTMQRMTMNAPQPTASTSGDSTSRPTTWRTRV